MTTTSVLVSLGVLAVGTFVVKAIGPFLAAGVTLPPNVRRLTELLTAALLAALVATQTIADGTVLTIDARLVGVGAAAVALALRAPFVVIVLVGAATTAITRALGWG